MTVSHQDDWDYRSADTKQVTHGIHPYPAMMIPQVAERLVSSYGTELGLLFDPYCGTGTTLLEGLLAGMTPVGTDLNPLARLIARVKTTPVSIDALDDAVSRCPAESPPGRVELPDVLNIDYWFSARAQRDLATILRYIDGIADPAIADVLRVAFSLTTRKASWTRNGEFKLHRIPADQLDRHSPDVFATMTRTLVDVRNALLTLRHVVPADAAPPSVHDFNTVHNIPPSLIAPGSVDLVVTSPPYGDSHTTVAYGQFSRLSSQWLGYEGAARVDNMLMGGSASDGHERFGFDKLNGVIGEIAALDDRRARAVEGFFTDYRASIRNVATAVRDGGHVCYVVGNRTVKGHEVPTAETTAAFFEAEGFELVELCTRNIPNKRMPSANSPSNIPGEVGKTMLAEHIVICRKASPCG